jgi:hypothetical protein
MFEYHVELKTDYNRRWRTIASFKFEQDRNTCLYCFNDTYPDCEFRPNEGEVNE